MNGALQVEIGGQPFAAAPLRLGLLKRVATDIPVLLAFFQRIQERQAAAGGGALAATAAMPSEAEVGAMVHLVYASVALAGTAMTEEAFSAFADELTVGDGLASLINACSAVLASSGITGGEAKDGAAAGEAATPAP